MVLVPVPVLSTGTLYVLQERIYEGVTATGLTV